MLSRSIACRCCRATRPTARGLPLPVGPRLTAGDGDLDGAPPETALEHEIVAAWSRVFGHEVRSVEADFFLDLGGHSLFAAMAVSDLRHKAALHHLAIADLYAHPTIRGLARHLEKHTTTVASHGERLRHSTRRVWAAARPNDAAVLFPDPLPGTDHGDGAAVRGTIVIGDRPHTRCRGLCVGGAAAGPAAAGGGQVAVAGPRPTGALSALGLVLLPLVAGQQVAPVGAARVPRRLAAAGAVPAVCSAPASVAAVISVLRSSTCPISSRSAKERASATMSLSILEHVADGWLHVKPVRIGAGAYVGANSVLAGRLCGRLWHTRR